MTTSKTDASNQLRRPLRLGLLCNSYSQPYWLRKSLGDLVSSNIIEIPLIAVRDVAHESAVDKFIYNATNFWRGYPYWFYRWYVAFDRGLSRVKLDAMSLGSLYDVAPLSLRMVVDPDRTHPGISLTKADADTIASHDLDVIFCSGLAICGIDKLELARHGVWTAESRADLELSGGGESFWEVMEEFPILKVELRRVGAFSNQGQILGRSILSTHLPDDLWSVHGSSSRLHWVAATLLDRKLNDLYRRGPQSLEECSLEESREPVLFDPKPPPDNRKMIKLLTKRAARRMRAWVSDKTRSDQWGLGYRFDHSVESGFGMSGFTKMVPPKDRFWADPFPVKYGDLFFIFLEEFLYSSSKGFISVIEMDSNGRWSKPVIIIERDYHLSYPCVFQWEGSYYMTPETGSNGTVELYKCVRFPYEWELERILIENVEAADPTLTEIDGTWWLFAGTRPYDVIKDDNYMELSIFSADSPLGPWKPHKDNPVKSDVRSSRPAGNLFFREGRLYRPAQDCSKDYGYAVSINRIIELTQERFCEQEVARILPEWIPGSRLVHTLNSCEGLTVIDTMNTISKV